ncbi:gp53-like domain-containing protein [Pseudomonas sp. NPDC089569]|uniref:gp53-like domain-containing protein n=1 Tax=Pseudomonas sp. NPDC089569 TaxID=3390722 RepID=UPI003D049C31
MAGVAAVGTGSKLAREDHRHPTDTTRAPLASPGLTGTPTAPTAPDTSNSTQIATTGHVLARLVTAGLYTQSSGSPSGNDADTVGASMAEARSTISTTANAPMPQWTKIWAMPVDASNGVQLSLGVQADRAFYRRKSVGVYQPWLEFAFLNSPAFTGAPTAPTAAPGTNTTQIATTAFIQTAISALVASSPAALDTLNELAAALGNDPNFATTITNALAGKQASLGFTPVQQGTGVGQQPNVVKIGWSVAAKLKATVDATDLGNLALENWVSSNYATLASPALTGFPSAPTASAGTNNTQLATTAFVMGARGGANVAMAATGNTTLTAAQYGADFLFLTGALTGNVTLTLPAMLGSWTIFNSTSGAFTVTVKAPGAGTTIVVTQGKISRVYGDGSTNVFLTQTDFISPALTGTPTAPSPAQFDSSQKLVTTDFLKNAGLVYGPGASISTSQTIPLAAVGGLISASGTITLTIPALSAVGAYTSGACITICNTGSGVISLATTGADIIMGTSGPQVSGITMRKGDSVVLVATAVGWMIVGGSLSMIFSSGQFGNSIAGTGYQKLPTGIILQWGNFSVAGATSSTFTFPLAFPSGCASIVASVGTSGTNQVNADSPSPSQYRIQNTHPTSAQAGSWFAIGY